MKTHLLSLLAALAAPAPDDQGAGAADDGDMVIITCMIPEDVDEDGYVLLQPESIFFGGRVARAHADLIDVRTHFLDRLMRLNLDV